MPSNRFCDRAFVREMLAGKTVALVGSGPGSLDNAQGQVDSHDVVVRVNNYKLFPKTGYRTDIFYSFFGVSIKKTVRELKRDGVKLCMCKCPDAKFIESDWHSQNGKLAGVDFRVHYRRRADWWFCPTYVPTIEEFMAHFEMLGRHVPTTGFSALLDVLSYEPAHVFMTGFDFFTSGVHNVTERWKPANPDDPIGHVPDAERCWLTEHADSLPISMDNRLRKTIRRDSA